ncbi:restriction endonuclease [Bradyrhizobium sp. S69]|uniref:restriction endonuclease n=1 Tax=Bradyrhizobium sp. S69 TaxID=1641856 RepID=UPI00131B847C|nr:restriction endonuclease [Bradyrhizobium sp. S69]
MARLSKRRIERFFIEGDTATTAAARGRSLEDLLIYLFSKIEGVRLVRRNALTEDISGEIDLIFWNDRTTLDFLPNVLLFECKNWSSRVDSAAIAFFISKATNRHLSHAFLIASNGITGDADQLRSAHAHMHSALVRDDCKIIVLERAELCALGSIEQLMILIVDKISSLYLLGP